MITVKTKLGSSGAHGIGLFADQLIPKGTITWKYDAKYDQAFTKEDVEAMSEITRNLFFKYAYWDEGLNKFVLCFDDQRFINHSDTPNIDSSPYEDIANRDIQSGEELFCNYLLFDNTYFDKIGFTH